MNSRKLYQEPLDQAWSESLLSAPSADRPGSVYDRLQNARQELEAAIREADSVLADNPLTRVVAEAAGRRANRRGTPSIVIRSDGSVFLEIHYKMTDTRQKVRKWESYLPSLAELRSEAQELGIDPAPYGRKRSELFKKIEQVKALKKKKMFRTSVAVGPVSVVEAEV